MKRTPILFVALLCAVAMPAAAQTLSFEQSSYIVSEAIGTLHLTVVRGGDTSGTFSGTYRAALSNCCLRPASSADVSTATHPLTFAPGETSKTISIPIINDARFEVDEHFAVVVERNGGRWAETGVAIVDDEPPLAMTNQSVREDSGAAVLILQRGGDLSAGLSVPVRVEAISSLGFGQPASPIVFAPGEWEKPVVVPLINDNTSSFSRQFWVAADDRYLATITIIDDDPERVTITADDVVVHEGESGERVAIVTLRKSSMVGTVNLRVRTADGTARAGEDYVRADGIVSLGSNVTATFPIRVFSDGLFEEEETFYADIDHCSQVDTLFGSCYSDRSVTILRTRVRITIKDHGTAFMVDETVTGEPAGSATGAAEFTVRLTNPLAVAASVDYETGSASADGGDFTHTRGTLTFAPGETKKTVTVAIHGDDIPEDEEVFVLRLSNAVGAPIVRGQALARILDDDPHFITTKDLQFTVADGVPLHLDLYVPTTGNGTYPLVIWIPGRDWMTAPRWPTPAFRQVNRGYAVAVVQYRTIEHGVFPAPLHDVKAAVRWLRANAERFGLDPNRFAVWGAGAGAHLAALAGTTDGVSALTDLTLGNAAISSRVQAVVDWAGPTDLTALGRDALPCSTINYDAIASSMSLLLGCPAVVCATEAVKASPAAYVTPDDPPFLIMHGEEDCVVSPRQSESFARLLKLRKVDATLKLYPGLGHIDGSWETTESMAAVDAFLDAQMKPGPRRRPTR